MSMETFILITHIVNVVASLALVIMLARICKEMKK